LDLAKPVLRNGFLVDVNTTLNALRPKVSGLIRPGVVTMTISMTNECDKTANEPIEEAFIYTRWEMPSGRYITGA
jgi:hypothetical protein